MQILESGQWFQGFVIFIIILSALMIGAKTYDISPLMERSLVILDWGVTVFFLVELCLRFIVCENKKRFFFDGWNVFDTIVVLGSLVPLQNADAVLIGRLLRVFRVLRLVSVVPELRFLINSLLLAIPRMGYIALLMFIIFYIYGAVGSLIFQQINQELWGDVSIAMLTLFRIATFEDWTDIMYETMAVHPISWIYYLTFIFLTAFVFLNMMVGTILEVMSAEKNKKDAEKAHQEREEMAQQINGIQRQLSVMNKMLEKKLQ
jgi:voltage-gated sodium channel